ncbi:hypothetical protein LOK49_LG12G02975 [Camellia lanceoleosa]|uniref:Uncharacterized protein n=1 Tax=Camellia lanceoleosa TaxID=1840588 RepID=A0ACC0FWG8_9ERIC|nr:hypothetical protein LOK49_LG12G02975 [Camellia lanceoleosa]
MSAGKCWEPVFSARAGLKFLENPECVLELQTNSPAAILACKAQISNIIMLTWFPYKITPLGSSISRIKHLHASN